MKGSTCHAYRIAIVDDSPADTQYVSSLCER